MNNDHQKACWKESGQEFIEYFSSKDNRRKRFGPIANKFVLDAKNAPVVS